MFAIGTLDETMMLLDDLREAFRIASNASQDYWPIIVRNMETGAEVMLMFGKIIGDNVTPPAHHTPDCVGHNATECQS